MNARRLRIYLGERDKDAEGHVLHETIVHRAHERGLAGASVFRGIVGYGARRELHTAKVLRLSEDLPVVVEIIDTAGKVDAFIPWLRETVPEGLMTVEDLDVLT